MAKPISVWRLSSGNLAQLDLLARLENGQASLNTISGLLPGGAYSTMRVYQGLRFLRLGEHIQRLSQTAEMNGLNLIVEEGQVRRALRTVLAGCEQIDLRLRLTLAFEAQPGDLYIAFQEWRPIAQRVYRQGVRVVTCRLRRSEPQAKHTRFIARADTVREGLAREVEEAILLGPGDQLLEGLSSNFFAIRDGEIWTAQQGVLFGVTRRLVLQCADRLALVVHTQPVLVSEIAMLSEAFITSSSRAILPVVKIDGQVVGQGKPGSLTRQLSACFQAQVQAELEEI